jgi:hypothetical protein
MNEALTRSYVKCFSGSVGVLCILKFKFLLYSYFFIAKIEDLVLALPL